ncbi:MAG: tetratricopeptide repeat protein [Gemmataceae bacterium]|nr:tetratricopeptide repeat protein [Gemmataceae bacterium]
MAALVAGLGAGGYVLLRPGSSTALPRIDMDGVDPAVQQAIAEAEAAVRAAPRSADAWGKLGMVLTSAVFEEAALACFRQAEALDPTNPRWPYFQGCIALVHGDREVLPALRRAVARSDDTLFAPRLRLAEECLRVGLVDEARGQFEEIVRRDDSHARAHLGLAQCAFHEQRLDAVPHHLARAVDHPRTRKAALALSAQWHRRRGDVVAADRALAAWAELPEDLDWPDELRTEVLQLRVGEAARVGLATALLDQGREAEALRLLHELVSEYPKSGRAWSLLGWALAKRRDAAGAEKALRTALDCQADDSQAHFELGRLRYQQGDRAGAIRHFRAAATLKPSYLQAHFNLGVCLEEEGDRAGATAAFRAAVLCQPLSAPAQARLGRLLSKDDPVAARSHLEQAIALNPDDAESRRLLASLKPPHD